MNFKENHFFDFIFIVCLAAFFLFLDKIKNFPIGYLYIPTLIVYYIGKFVGSLKNKKNQQ